MSKKNIISGALLAVGIFAAIVCVGMVTGFTAAQPFISVDPVSDKNSGDAFTITGNTSLPAGSEILVDIHPSSLDLKTGLVTDPKTGATVRLDDSMGATGMIGVENDPDGIAAWSFDVPSKKFLAGEYTVIAFVYDKNKPAPGEISGTTTFTVHGTQAPTGTAQYIKIDPVPDKTTGDLLIVSGSTNFPAGTILMVQVGSPGIGFGSDTMVREGTGGVNRYSMPADTAILKPGTQTITVTNMKGDLEKGDYGLGDVNSTATFTLKGTYLGTDAPVQPAVTKDDFIRINAIGDKTAKDQFLISGTTSLPAGVGLIWQVMPYTGTVPTGLDMNAKGIMANNPVTKGDGTANRVSLAVDLGNMEPGEYIAIVGPMKGDPENRDIAMGDPIGSARFTVV